MKVTDSVTIKAGGGPITTVWFDGTIPLRLFRFVVIGDECFEAFPVMGKARNVVDIKAEGDFTGKEIRFE